METYKNQFNEIVTKWTSHKHPDNPNFCQMVSYMHIQCADGRNNLYWSLKNSAPNDKYIIPNITLSDALNKFTDIKEKEISEDEFQKWLIEKSK